ncbi:unnamed protein product [Paramecium pentaurelia]|uniref:Uncharacterized protein n=1 Tax=Paramecium pentaurelia TaxID=43138 RepID=A0A8S1SQ08_9CILI|nr:unnamed protein product [Paramecium pentaurelia]
MKNHGEMKRQLIEIRTSKFNRDMNQKDRTNIEEEGQVDQDQEIIYCERCGSGPYRSA